VLGINVWIKPMKFFVSTTIFLWTVAWFRPQVASRFSGTARGVSITIGVAMVFEMVGITIQAARGTTSHFNVATQFDAAIFNMMGVLILVNTIAMIVFLAIIRRDTPPQRAGYLWGIRLGIALFLLASFEGGLIVANNAHTVGSADGGPGLPFLNWSTQYGDLRIAHFVGMHAMQALSLLGFFLDRSRLPARNLVIEVSILWLAVMGGLLVTAMQGRPLLAL
jgi:hypothetical protein